MKHEERVTLGFVCNALHRFRERNEMKIFIYPLFPCFLFIFKKCHDQSYLKNIKKIFRDERREKFKYLLKNFHLAFGFIFYFCELGAAVLRENKSSKRKNPLSFFHCLGALPLRERLKASRNLTRLVNILSLKRIQFFPLRRGFRIILTLN